jgi:hypothetical protein
LVSWTTCAVWLPDAGGAGVLAVERGAAGRVVVLGAAAVDVGTARVLGDGGAGGGASAVGSESRRGAVAVVVVGAGVGANAGPVPSAAFSSAGRTSSGWVVATTPTTIAPVVRPTSSGPPRRPIVITVR